MNAAAPTDGQALLTWVERCLAESSCEPDFCALILPARELRAAALFARATAPAVYWQPSSSTTVVGLGSAAELIGQGAERFSQVRSQAAACRATVYRWPGISQGDLRWFGGFAFAPGQCFAPPWGEFGDARFILPRFVYERAGERAWLMVTASRAEREHVEGRRAILQQLGTLLASAAGDVVEHSANWRLRVPPIVEPEHRDYRERVRAIQRAISGGELSKVVAARRVVLGVGPAGPTEFMALLERLRSEDDSSTVFAFRFGSALFGGASPERLISKRASELQSEAVAGSAAAGSRESAQQLLKSPKNRLEHHMVVQSLHERLAPVCAELPVPGPPRIRMLNRVLHLCTDLPGRLRAPLHVLELVERLHPSPAVGGLPTDKALDWILKHEPYPRGWYAAPVGWFDRHGDGDFSVALRSGVFVGPHAYLYAGAGIVTQSDAEEELRETELKLSTLRTALGVERP